MSEPFPSIPLAFHEYPPKTMVERSQDFFELLNRRRTVRDFSDRPIPRALLENLIRTASTAPSGANKQPWNFCVVTDPEMKSKIRVAAEKEELENYSGRMSPEWVEDLAHLGTDEHKPFLEIAPALVIIFKKAFDYVGDQKKKNYYVNESVGLAAGMFLAAAHHAGLVTLTHTPSPMNFLSKLLDRPDNERPFLLIPIGYPMEGARVPDIQRKPLDAISVWYE